MLDACRGQRGKTLVRHEHGLIFPERSGAQTTDLNAHAERFVRTSKESCLDRMILFGEGSLRRAIKEFVEHYDRERNHQGLGNRLLTPQGIRVESSQSMPTISLERYRVLITHSSKEEFEHGTLRSSTPNIASLPQL